MKPAFALFAISVALSSCATPGPIASDPGIAVSSGPTAERLTGGYMVVAVNGKRALSSFSVQFSPSEYGGYDGCNSYFGQGLANGARYFAGPGSQTLRGCTANTSRGRRMLAQGQTVAQIVGGGFTARDLGNGRIMLISEHDGTATGTVTIEGALQKAEVTASNQMPLSGTAWEAFLLNSERSAYVKTADNQYLRFSDDRVAAKFSCASFVGGYVLDGNRISIVDLAVTEGENCTSADDIKDAEFRALLTSEMRYSATENSILIGSPAGELYGDKERPLAR